MVSNYSMCTAEQARKETKRRNELKTKDDFNFLWLKITEAINNGLYYTSGKGHINPVIMCQLKDLGYDVSNDVFENTDFYFISWW